MEKENIFEEIDMENNETPEVAEKSDESSKELPTNEINYDNLTDTPIGQTKKYNRESLDGETVKIFSAKLFNPDINNDELITSMTNKDTKYYKTKFILTYDKENSEGVKHREYLSGAIQFLQRDNSISAPVLWFEGATNQVADLFEKVAKFKGIEPKELSPREFMNFLNSGPKCVIKSTEVKFMNKVTQKNLVEKFV